MLLPKYEAIEAERLAKEESERKAEAERIAKEKAEQEELMRILKQKEEELKKSQEANKEKRENEAKEILIKGLIELKDLNDFNKGKPIIEKYFKLLEGSLITEESQVSLLKDFVTRCIQKSNKRWKKQGKQDWALVKKWVGQNLAKDWYSKVINK